MARPVSKGGRYSHSSPASRKKPVSRRVRSSTAEAPTVGPFPEEDQLATQPRISDPGNLNEDHREAVAHQGPYQDDPYPSVPKSLVKFIVGIFLAPFAWVLSETFFQSFAISLKHGLLASQSFGCFAAGMVLFGILFAVVPRNILMLSYVFGHEVTHALWAKLLGGKVANRFHVSLEGGHVLTDRVNTWIVLSPYFFPIYSVLVVTLYGALKLAARLIGNPALVSNVDAFHWLIALLIGMTLAFHLVFTCLLIVKGQPDLHYGGTFFSLILIYTINLLIITGLLLATGKHIGPETFGRLLLGNAADFVEFLRNVAVGIGDWIGNLRAGMTAT